MTSDGKEAFVWWEGPVKRGAGSPFKIVGQEMHSSVFEMTLFTELAAELSMRPVYVDQGSAGLWLRRRVAVLRAGVEDQEFEPMKIPEVLPCLALSHTCLALSLILTSLSHP